MRNLALFCVVAFATLAEAQEISSVLAAPRSEVFYPPVAAADGEPHVATGSGTGWQQVIFDVQKVTASAGDPRYQHAIVVDYTPGSARVRAWLQGEDGYIRTPEGWEPVWGEADVRGYGVGGRLYWCYSFAQLVDFRTTFRSWRLLFYPTNYGNETFSYRFAAVPTDSISCERTGENDGGLEGVGTGGDFGPFNVYVDGQKGDQTTISVGIRDHGCEDGDVVSVYIGDGFGDRTIFSNAEIFNSLQERTVGVRIGYYYQVRAVAINGTGGKGNCDPPPGVNTGEMHVESQISTWRAPGGTERAGFINIIGH